MGKEKKKKRRRSSSSSSSSDDERKLKKLKKKLKKEQRRAEKILKKKIKAEKKKLLSINSKTKSSSQDATQTSVERESDAPADIPVALMERSKAMAPMTKEEWDKRQSVVRKVYDEESGRYRLIKGDGEVIESIVSREQHKKINQTATQSDGVFFQTKTAQK